MSSAPTELDALYDRALGDVAAFVALHRALLEATLIVTTPEPVPAGAAGLAAGKALGLNTTALGSTRCVLAFTSETAARKAFPAGCHTLAVPAATLFEMARGGGLVLNQGAASALVFSPEEVIDLAEGRLPESAAAMAERDVLIGEPDEEPEHLLEPLRRLLAGFPEVGAGYRAVMTPADATGAAAPVLLVAIDCAGAEMSESLEAALAEAATAAGAMEIMPVREGDPLSDHLVRDTVPFYRRRAATDFLG